MAIWLALALGLELPPDHGTLLTVLLQIDRPIQKRAEAIVEGVAGAVRRAWTRRPEWADELLSILHGEQLQLGAGWFKLPEDTRGWDWLRERFDRDRDGRVTRSELGSAQRYVGGLDQDGDETITAHDFAPLARDASRDPGLAVFRLLDEDRNNKVSWDELSWFFQKADRRKQGYLSRQDLARVLEGVLPQAAGGHDVPDSDARESRWSLLERLFDGELGSFREGPALGSAAPEFELPSLRPGRTVRLSDSKGKRPVLIVFGSFT